MALLHNAKVIGAPFLAKKLAKKREGTRILQFFSKWPPFSMGFMTKTRFLGA